MVTDARLTKLEILVNFKILKTINRVNRMVIGKIAET